MEMGDIATCIYRAGCHSSMLQGHSDGIGHHSNVLRGHENATLGAMGMGIEVIVTC